MQSFFGIALADAADVCVVALLLWMLISWTRRVHATQALLGLGFIGLFYLVALQLQLRLTAWLFQGFFTALVVLLVVVFQDDLRRLFERIAAVGLRRRPPAPDAETITALVQAVTQLSRGGTGALMVVPGRESLGRHVQGGIAAAAEISAELLVSIFHPQAPGHDGAVVVAGDRIERFAAHLPLSDDRGQLGERGTRHAAALGLAERSDALCVAVSEERGTVTVAAAGRLRTLERPELLMGELRRHLATSGALSGPSQWHSWSRWRRGLLEVLSALILAVAGWFFLVPGEEVDQATRSVAVMVENMPVGYDLEGVSPAAVQVTVKGSRRALMLADEVGVAVDADLVRLGRRTFVLDYRSFRHTPELEVIDVSPAKVRLAVRQP